MADTTAWDLVARLSLDDTEYEQGLQKAKSSSSILEGAASSFGGALSTAAKIGAAALAATSTAVVAFGTASVEAGKAFDSSMSQVAATMGYTVEELNTEGSEAQQTLQQLRDYAQEMGSTTAFSATEAADALNYMALAGYDAETSMQMLPNVLNLAAAGGIGLAEASDMVTDAQSALGLTLDETATMVDQMAAASSKSNTSVAQLGEAMLTIGATARNMKGGTEELSTMLGVLADNGIKGAEGGTHLRNMILSLQSPTDDAKAALESLGVAVYDSDGNMRSMIDIMQDINAGLGDMDQASKDAIIGGIFNKTDLAAVNALLGTSSERFDELSAAIRDSEGAAQAMAEVQLDNLEGDITLFKSALEGAQIVVSDQLTPGIREFVQFGTDGISRLTEAFKEGGLSGAMEEFGSILSEGLSMIIEKIPEVIEAGGQLLSALGQGLLENLPVITDAAVQVITQFGQGLVQAIPALIEGAIQIILGLAQGLIDALPEAFPMIQEMLMQIGQMIIDNAPLILESAVEIITQLAQGMADALPELIPMAYEVVLTIAEALIDSIDQLIEPALQIIVALAEGLINALPVLIEKIPEIIEKVIDVIIDNLPLIIETIATLYEMLIQALVDNLPTLLQKLPELVEKVIEVLTDNLPQILELVVSLMGDIIMALVEATPTILASIVECLVKIMESIAEFAATILGNIGELLLEVGKLIVEALGEFFASIGKGIADILDSIKEFISNLWEKLKDGAKKAVENFIKFWKELPGKVWDIITDTIDNVINFASDLKDKAIEAAKGFVDNLIEGVEGLPGAFLDIGKNIVDGIWEGISAGWTWLTDSVSNLASDLFDAACDVLGIASPSKKFKWIGEMVDDGFTDGIEQNAYKVDSAMDNLTDTSEYTDDTEPTSNAGGAGRGGYSQTINITSPTALSPAEIARQTRNATRDMVLSIQGV